MTKQEQKPNIENLINYWGISRYQMNMYKNGGKQTGGNIIPKNAKVYNHFVKGFKDHVKKSIKLV